VSAPTRRLGWLRDQGMPATILVGAISTAFGVILLSATEYVAAMVRSIPGASSMDIVRTTLGVASTVLLSLAVYVGAIVTANTFSTVVAGRVRQIALMRLLGSSAQRERATIARQGLVLGVLGAAVGLLGGLFLAVVGLELLSDLWNVDVAWTVLRPDLIGPVVAVVIVTWAAAWVGSRRVITVTPLQALSQSAEAGHDHMRTRRGRNITAAVLLLIGGGLLAIGTTGLLSSNGILVAFLGGMTSFTGVALGATLIVPPALRAVGALFGRSAVARLAATNALRHPERSARTAIGVVMGVALVTMFAVAAASATRFLEAAMGESVTPEISTVIDTFTAVLMALVGVSAVIAAVGVVNLLTLGVLQRRRELGLLRALGLSGGQVRGVILLEAAHVVVTAVALGLLLGGVYGWAGTQAMLGWMPQAAGLASGPVFVPPVLPLPMVAGVVGATAVLTLAASVLPTRLATRLSPVRALAVEA